MSRSSMPTADDLLSSAHVISVPLRTRFRGIVTREVCLVCGPVGWGEFAPFIEYEDDVAARWLAAAVEAGWGSWPEPVRGEVPINATVPAVPAARVADVLARFPEAQAVKVKVAERGQSLAEDIDRVGEARACLGPHAEIKVDANGGWSLEEAQVAIAALNRFDLAYVEQPCASVEDLAQVRRALAAAGVDVLVAADESIRRAEDPMRVRDLEAADVAVVKVAPLGGVAEALRVTEAVGLPTVVSSALDTSVGISAGVALAAALPELPFACGLGTVALLAEDVAERPMLPQSGLLLVTDEVRTGGVSDEALQRLAAPPEREQWWLERLARCRGLLGEGLLG